MTVPTAPYGVPYHPPADTPAPLRQIAEGYANRLPEAQLTRIAALQIATQICGPDQIRRAMSMSMDLAHLIQTGQMPDAPEQDGAVLPDWIAGWGLPRVPDLTVGAVRSDLDVAIDAYATSVQQDQFNAAPIFLEVGNRRRPLMSMRWRQLDGVLSLVFTGDAS